MLRTAILGVIFYVVGTSLSLGQQQFPKPGPEHERLKDLEGNWDAVMQMGDQKTKGTHSYKAICGGMWIAGDYQGELGGGVKFQGHGLDGYDQTKKKYVSLWVDSLTSAPLHLEGDYDPKTKVVAMSGASTDAAGKPEKVRITAEWKGKDHFTFKMFTTPTDGKEQLAFTIEYSRRK